MNIKTPASPAPTLTREDTQRLYRTMTCMLPGYSRGVFKGACWHWVVADMQKPTWILECVHPFRSARALEFPMHKRTTKDVVTASARLVADVAQMFGVTEMDVIRTAKEPCQ